MHSRKSIFPASMRGIYALIIGMVLLQLTGPVVAGGEYDDGGEEEQLVPLDFLTGGGWILRPNGAKANFGVGGGVKHNDWWGHLNYLDHGTGLHVRDTSITAYIRIGVDGSEAQNGQPTGTRDVCGTAVTNLFGDVDFHLRATDNGEPGRDDIFILRLGLNGVIVYTTEGDFDHTLGGPGPGGGNIQLHKGNRSNTAPASPPVCNI